MTPVPSTATRTSASSQAGGERAGGTAQADRYGALGLSWASGGGHNGAVTPPEDKTCASCGRRIEWRQKWARSWDDVRYCSDACRRRKLTSVDVRLEELLRALVEQAGRKGVDPDDAARGVDPSAREALHEPARRAARRLVAVGAAEMVQGGRVVDPSTAKGAVRVRAV